MDEFDRIVDETHDVMERLFPDEESLDGQRPVLGAWFEALEERDVVWCVGRSAGAYALLAAEHIGGERVVVFQSDASRLSTVRSLLESAGHGSVTVEPLTLLEWQTPDVRAEDAITIGPAVEDPVQAMVDARGTPDWPTVLALDVPGYGADVLSSVHLQERADVRAVLFKTSDTFAESELADAGFETTLVAERRSMRAPWRRATFAGRDPDVRSGIDAGPRVGAPTRDDDEVESTDSASAASEATAFGGVEDEREWRLPDVASLAIAGALYALSGVFYGIAVLLEVLAKVPGFRYVFANAMIGVIVAVLFGAFLLLGFLLSELTGPLGVSEQAAAGVAGALVVALPIAGALGFVWLAITTRTDDR